MFGKAPAGIGDSPITIAWAASFAKAVPCFI
ncbi:MAG: hypothetical protein FD152_1436, partial [Xanthobacteraceae bacterium]